ncbi:MAG: DNA translocase FtsK [Angelakisella sp.]
MATTKTSSKGGKSAAAKKRPTAAERKSQAEKQAKKRLYAILLFALGVMVLFLAAVPGEKAWNSIHEALLGCFSWCAYLLGPILIYTAVMIDLDKTSFPVAAKLISSAMLILLLCGASQIFSKTLPGGGLVGIVTELFRTGILLEGGGAAGVVFGIPLLIWLDFTGAAITIVVLIFVCVMIVSGGTIAGLLHGMLVKPVKQMEGVYNSAVETRAQMIIETPPPPVRTKKSAQIDVSLEDDPFRLPPMTIPKAPKRSEPVMESPKDKLLDAFMAMDTPTGAPAAKPVPTQTTLEEKLFNFDAHNGKDTPPPQKSAAVAVATAPAPVAQEGLPWLSVDNPVEYFGEEAAKKAEEQDDLPSIDEIINRAVAADATAVPAAVAEPAKKAEPKPTPPAPPVEEVKDAVLKPEYTFPPVSLLKEGKQLPKGDTTKELKANADRLVDTLKSFGVQTRIVDISRGPAVTRYELQPSAGVKISRITNLADDIALNLAAAGVRIEAPIPNKAAIGIEVPNKIISTVAIRELLDSTEFTEAKSKLTVVLGRDITGELTLADLGKMPHLLIAGATGSGKSVCINSLIISLLYKANPDEVKLLMIDPKVVELGSYNGIPHLLSPVVTDPKKAAGALCTMVGEMLRRYKLFADHNVRDLTGYNKLAAERPEVEAIPQIVIIIDELADLMMASPKDVEDYICRLAQMARAAGMHLVIATQRPSVDVITGVIKANIPSRISFAVSSQIDSRTILDMGGAEKLLGRGDMLFYPVGSAKPTRVQGCFVTDSEVEKVVDFIKTGSVANYDQTLMEDIEKNAAQVGGKGSGNRGGSGSSDGGDNDSDELINNAIEAVVEAGQASTSLLQRRLKVGYARAARLVDEMEQRGIVGPFEGSKPRQVMISKERWYEMKMNMEE